VNVSQLRSLGNIIGIFKTNIWWKMYSCVAKQWAMHVLWKNWCHLLMNIKISMQNCALNYTQLKQKLNSFYPCIWQYIYPCILSEYNKLNTLSFPLECFLFQSCSDFDCGLCSKLNRTPFICFLQMIGSCLIGIGLFNVIIFVIFVGNYDPKIISFSEILFLSEI
jgi:hypothetical protein